MLRPSALCSSPAHSARVAPASFLVHAVHCEPPHKKTQSQLNSYQACVHVCLISGGGACALGGCAQTLSPIDSRTREL
eukprot:77176-Rhodomonas_salina.2